LADDAHGPDSPVREVTIAHERECIFLPQGTPHEGVLADLKEEPPGAKSSELKRPHGIKKSNSEGDITVT